MTSEFLTQGILYILLIPFFSAIFIAFFLRKGGVLSAGISVSAALGILLVGLHILWHWQGHVLHASIPWFQLGSVIFRFGILFDHMSALMLLVVACIGFLVHIFSIGYMKEDLSQGRYFGSLSLFMFSMLGIVFADNLILMFIFWELVGFSSYILIAHYYQKPFAALASKKAFIVNRVGDFGFLIGIIWTYWQYGSVDFSELFYIANSQPEWVITPIGFLLICGFLGKSAQFPLHVWLPDAMAGPTPVSALIHAATMVAAGVFLVARVFFLLTPEVLYFILWICSGMTVFAGLCALFQKDIKKILAYSTLSQLGYMGVALGLNMPGLALFHLSTHACFKATLFLCAASIIHGLNHEQDIYKMGGLFRKMPITSIAFSVALLALCGVYGTSGFFSKDAILEAAYMQHKPIFYIISTAVFLTALYMGRLFIIVFLGTPRSPKASHAHEGSVWMLIPLILLAFFSIVAGYIDLWPLEWRLSFTHELISVHEGIHAKGGYFFVLILGACLSCAGLLLSFLIYGKKSTQGNRSTFIQSLSRIFEGGLYIDNIYDFYINKVQQRLISCLYFIDLGFISGLFMRGSAGLVGLTSLFLKRTYTGNVQHYLYWFLGGILIFSYMMLTHF